MKPVTKVNVLNAIVLQMFHGVANDSKFQEFIDNNQNSSVPNIDSVIAAVRRAQNFDEAARIKFHDVVKAAQPTSRFSIFNLDSIRMHSQNIPFAFSGLAITTVCIIIILFCVYRKQRFLSAGVMLSTMARPTNALESQCPQTLFSVDTDFAPSSITVIFTVVAIIIIYTCYNHYRRTFRRDSILVFELNSNRFSLNLHVLKFAKIFPNELIFRSDSYLNSLAVSGIIFPVVKIDWRALVIQRASATETFTLPTQLAINFFDSIILRMILATPYTAHIYIAHQAHFHEVKIVDAETEIAIPQLLPSLCRVCSTSPVQLTAAP
jgi:hypothetical protein